MMTDFCLPHVLVAPQLHAFSLTTRRWSQIVVGATEDAHQDAASPRVLTTAPLVRTGHCATVHAGRLLLFGGLDERNQLLDNVVSLELIA